MCLGLSVIDRMGKSESVVRWTNTRIFSFHTDIYDINCVYAISCDFDVAPNNSISVVFCTYDGNKRILNTSV